MPRLQEGGADGPPVAEAASETRRCSSAVACQPAGRASPRVMGAGRPPPTSWPVSYTHLRAHETSAHL
eukprot:793860-Alexandrium_andersonii.AAC.1